MGSLLFMLLWKPRCRKLVNQFDIPFPKTLHLTVSAETLGNRQVLIIGDVHGCYDELIKLLQKANATPENTLLISCGDLINRGPKSTATVRFIRSLGSAALSVRGNHEERVIKEWQVRNGLYKDKTTQPAAKYDWVTELCAEDINFLMNLPYTISLPSLQSTVVHGGLDPWKSLEQQQPVNMTLMRNIIEPESDQYKIEEAIDDGVAWASCWTGPNHVYFGHDARRRLQTYKFATGLDTACVYGGKLTGVLLKHNSPVVSREFISVDASETYKEKQVKHNTNPAGDFYW